MISRTQAAPGATCSSLPRRFVILSRGHAAEALAWTKAVMTKLPKLVIDFVHEFGFVLSATRYAQIEDLSLS